MSKPINTKCPLYVAFVELVPTIEPFEEGKKLVRLHFYTVLYGLCCLELLQQEVECAASAAPAKQHQ
jgi:hypothetical protein